MKTMLPTMNLRYHIQRNHVTAQQVAEHRNANDTSMMESKKILIDKTPTVLQQAWMCLETGDTEWKNVETIVEFRT